VVNVFCVLLLHPRADAACGGGGAAGLPFAMAGLFLAEPLGVPRVLLPAGLTALLQTATDESLTEPWPRVREGARRQLPLTASHCGSMMNAQQQQQQ
jgi:hypothetical protein